MYNALAKSDGKYEYMAGSNIANASVATIKLEKTSDSYMLPDSTSVATSKAVYNLYEQFVAKSTENTDSAVWAIDTNSTQDKIIIDVPKNFSTEDTCFFSILTKSSKSSTTTITANITSSSYTGTLTGLKIYNPDGTALSRGFAANKNIKLLWVAKNKAFYLISSGSTVSSSRYIYTCTDQETVISYSTLSYNTGDLIHVYRNGVRLFQDLDYSMNEKTEEITLYVRTEEGERIVFETISAVEGGELFWQLQMDLIMN
jgi:hypothetical protein